MVRKISPQDLLPVLAAPLPKFLFSLFDSDATTWVKFENFDLERVFRFGL